MSNLTNRKEVHMGVADIVVLVFCILAGIAFAFSD